MLSCSKKDETPENSIKISPPAWILGTWQQEGIGASTNFRFTSDDFCTGFYNTAFSCNKEMLNSAVKSNAAANVKEISSDTQYSIEITIASQVVTYSFQKVSATKIKWVNTSIGSDVVYIKQ